MTSKKHKQAIADSLSSALEPPKSRRPSPALNDILSQYAPAPETSQTRETLGTQSTQSTQGDKKDADADSPPAPTRDFQKVANSITRVAVPAGVFKGKCKQLYDFLYSKTRGAITPAREVRLTRREIMHGSDIGSTKTLFLNLRHLRDSGLVTWDERAGPHEGNIYSVYLPEEVINLGTQSTLSTQSDSSYKVLRVLRVESTQSTHSSFVENTGTSGNPKTLYKTNTENDDDEALAPLLAQIRRAVKEITGKEPSRGEEERWRELGELLVTELKIAAGRTTVSNVPAFFTEHLRRRLWKKTDAQLRAENAPQGDSVQRKANSEECPDCFGTGMWYPEGFDKGVSRCGHEKLKAGKPGQD